MHSSTAQSMSFPCDHALESWPPLVFVKECQAVETKDCEGSKGRTSHLLSSDSKVKATDGTYTRRNTDDTLKTSMDNSRTTLLWSWMKSTVFRRRDNMWFPCWSLWILLSDKALFLSFSLARTVTGGHRQSDDEAQWFIMQTMAHKTNSLPLLTAFSPHFAVWCQLTNAFLSFCQTKNLKC